MSPMSMPGAESAPHSHATFSVLKFAALIWSSGEYLVEVSPPVMVVQSALFWASPARPDKATVIATANPPTHVWRVQFREIPLFIVTSDIDSHARIGLADLSPNSKYSRPRVRWREGSCQLFAEDSPVVYKLRLTHHINVVRKAPGPARGKSPPS